MVLSNTFSIWDEARQNLASRVTLITGAGRGIGKEAALALVGIGARVAIADLVQERAEAAAADLRARGGDALAIRADITNRDDVEAMMKAVVDRFGVLHNLVNCAGSYKAKSPSLTVSDEEWDFIVESNLKGTFRTCRAAIPYMIDGGGGAIVNISSLAGRTCSPFLGVHYSAAKAGVLGVTRHLANEFGPQGIRVNSIAPGTTLGERVSEIAPEDQLRAQAAATPLRRLAEGRDIAGVILFLLSDLSQFVTGVTIDTNGGFLTI